MNNHISLAALAIVAVLAACTKNPIETPSDSNRLADLEITSVNSVQTKAAVDGRAFPTDGKIGLFLCKDEKAVAPYGDRDWDGYANVKYSYNEHKGKWTASPSIKVGSTPGYLYGYYPYNETATDIKAIPVSSSVNGDDIMYASPVKNVTDQTASHTAITMNHALARVAITVVNKGYTGDAKLSSIKFAGAEMASTGTLNALDGSITATKSDVTLNVPASNQDITAAGTTIDCLLVPSGELSDKQDVAITLTIDGQDKTALLSGNNGVIIARNTKSNITITLSNSGISVQTVSVEDWNVIAGEHKVTIRMADGVDRNDVLTTAYAEGNTVKIISLSRSDKHLECAVIGTAEASRTISGNTCLFTVSNIGSDVTATISYETPLAITFSSNNSSWGWATYEGKPYTGERINIKANTNDGYCFVEWQDAEGTTLSKDNPYSVTLTSDLTVKAVFNNPAGAFTISDDNGRTKKLILFSPGNLYYDGNNRKWAFEANQYDFRTYTNGPACIDGTYKTTRFSPQNHCGLFGWVGNSSKFYNVPELYGVSESCYYSGNGRKEDYGHVTGEPLYYDWGITIDDSRTWRTLTVNEWRYLLYGRTNAGYKRGFARVCGVPGMIFLPDIFTDPNTNSGSKPFAELYATQDGWDANVYSAADWAAMETAGAVFLPAAGQRYDSSVMHGGDHSDDINGFYWSSTSYDDNWETYPWAYCISFNHQYCEISGYDRCLGHCVRLVKEMQ